jgi:alpha-D-ribose 1-methylphosphonate 5-phosphate C-P lyase
MQEKEHTRENNMKQTHNPQCEEPIPDTLRTITPEEAARATLHGVVCDLGHDEVRVLTRIAEWLRAGRLAYGLLFLENVAIEAPAPGCE